MSHKREQTNNNSTTQEARFYFISLIEFMIQAFYAPNKPCLEPPRDWTHNAPENKNPFLYLHCRENKRQLIRILLVKKIEKYNKTNLW